MDKLDRQILYELDRNARSSFHEISRNVKIPEETVRYRVQRFFAEGIVDKCIAMINSTLLGFSYYELFIKLQNVTPKRKIQILKWLEQKQYIIWTAEFEGNFDIGMILMVKTQFVLQSLIEEIHDEFGSNILKKSLSVNLVGEFFPRAYLVSKEREYQSIKYSHDVPNPIVLSVQEEMICMILAKNARISVLEIAKRVKMTAPTVAKKIRSLKKRNVLLGYMVLINNEKIGQSHYKVMVYLNKCSQEKLHQLMTYVSKNERLIAMIQVLASWDFEFDLEVEDSKQLKEFTMELMNEFSDVIRDYEVIQIISMPKYTFYPYP